MNQKFLILYIIVYQKKRKKVILLVLPNFGILSVGNIAVDGGLDEASSFIYVYKKGSKCIKMLPSVEIDLLCMLFCNLFIG